MNLYIEEGKSPCCICKILLDDIYFINNQHSYQTDDAILVEVARRLLQSLDMPGIIARSGDGEFSVAIPHITQEHAQTLIKRISKILATDILVNDQPYRLNTRIGTAIYPENGQDSATLMQYAVSAIYDGEKPNRSNISCQ